MIQLSRLLAILPGPVLSRDDPFNPAPADICLIASESAVRADGLGLAAVSCTDDPGQQSNAGMTGCFGVELNPWEELLNAACGRLMAVENAIEAGFEASESSVSNPAEALHDMQRAGMNWCTASWLYKRSQWGGGTGGGPAVNECAMHLTVAQARMLDDRFAQVEGK